MAYLKIYYIFHVKYAYYFPSRLYQEKFGFIFIIFAKGKSSPQILEALKRRYHALPYEELQVAAGEQMKITELRLGQLLGISEELEAQQRSQKRADQVLNQVILAFINHDKHCNKN